MRSLTEYLDAVDREHLKKILNSSLSVTPAGLENRAKAHRFLQSRTFVDEQSAPVFRKLPSSARESILSELVWRIMCLFDGSITAVLGAVQFKLGNSFVAVWGEEAGSDYFCLTAV